MGWPFDFEKNGLRPGFLTKSILDLTIFFIRFAVLIKVGMTGYFHPNSYHFKPFLFKTKQFTLFGVL